MSILPVIGAAIGMGGDVFRGAQRRNQEAANIDRQQDHNLEIAKYNNSQMYQNWLKQQEYNKPEMQMQRFKNAGLNPNLIYGQTNTASPIQTSELKTTDQALSPILLPQFDLMDAMASYQNYQLRDSQIKNTDSVTKLNDIKSTHEIIKQSKTLTETEKKRLEKQLFEEMMPHRIYRAPLETSILHDKARLAFAEAERIPLTNENRQLKNDIARIQRDMEDYRKEKLQTSGLEKNDPYYIKLLYELLDKTGKLNSLK